MTTLAKVKRAAAALGATVEDSKEGHTHECTVEAPHRHIWKSDDIHMLIDACYRPWKPDYADLLRRMSYGLEPCTDPDCDWCNSEEDA